MKQRFFLVLSLVTLIVSLSACSSNKTSTKTTTGHKIRAAVVTDVGGINDMSFNANTWIGLQRAQKELGIQAKFVESKEQADYEVNLRELADARYDLVIGVGFMMKDAVEKVAKECPNTKFVLIDAESKKLSNVQSQIFREQEVAFLAGALAGCMTKSGTIGFVGGMDVPVIQRFTSGYQAGAKTVRPDIKVLIKYTNNWVDIASGKELALSEFNQGADIVAHGAGRCGIGVINAAKERGQGYYAIGVDADQDYLGCKNLRQPAPPCRVLTSMMKRVDITVFDTCKQLIHGQFKAGSQTFGIKDGGLDLSPFKYTRKDIPDATLQKVSRLKQLIIKGQLKPPATPAQLDQFDPPVVR
jgi:basic membrane protein A